MSRVIRTCSRVRAALVFCAALAGAGPAVAAISFRTAPGTPNVIGDPPNRLEQCRVTLGSGLAIRATGGAESAVLDGNPATAMSLDDAPLTFSFIGAPRWINRIVIGTDAPAFSIEVEDMDHAWQPYLQGAGTTDAAPQVLIASYVYCRGLRFVPHAPDPSASVRLATLEARSVQHDPDKDRLGVGDDGISDYHYDYVNNYPSGSTDLTECDDSALGLRDELPGDWSTYGHGNSNAYENHLKSSSYGTGNNNSHLDNRDIGLFAGHGCVGCIDSTSGNDEGAFLLGDQSHDDGSVPPTDAYLAWGDYDMEWYVSSACQALKSSHQSNWHDAMDGLHLMCGNEDDVLNAAYGKTFGQKAVDNGAFDSAELITQSWFDAVDDFNGDHEVAVVIGENSTMLNDYIWGQASGGASDPTHDNSYVTDEYDVGSAAPVVDARPMSAPLVYASVPGEGWTVTIDRSTLSQAQVAQMVVYNVTQQTIDSTNVRALATAICQIDHVLCDGDIGPGDPGQLNLIDGMRELRMNTVTGAWRYTDTGGWLRWRPQRPLGIPLGDAAITRAEQYLESIGRRPADASVIDVHYLNQRATMHDPGGPDIVQAESTFTIASDVRYQRHLGMASFPVVGPGGSMSVTLGANGNVQRVFVGGWRPVTPGPMVTTVPIDTVIAELTRFGDRCVIGQVGPVATGVAINSYEMGYFEPWAGAPVNVIRPVYILHCTLTCTGGAPFARDLYVYADGQPPTVIITAPSEGASVSVGSTLCLNSTISGGLPPYSIQWITDGQVIGTTSNLCVVLDSYSGLDGSADSTRTFELHVRDQRGNANFAITYVRFLNITGVNEEESPEAMPPVAIHPNPVRRSAHIDFTVPPGDAFQRVALRVYDAGGRCVRTLANDERTPGRYALDWNRRDEDGRSLPPGVYSLRLDAAAQTFTRRIVLLP